jgi:hypothetical protein
VNQSMSRLGQALTVPGSWCSQISRQSAYEVGKVISTHWPPLPPGNIPGTHFCCRSQSPRDLRRRSTVARLLRSWVRIPPGHEWLLRVLCVISYRSLRRADHSSIWVYRLWRVVVCDQETSWTRRPLYPRWAAEPQEAITRAGLQSHRRP